MQQKILNNRYELEQKIGEGGMARVYRGRDLRLNRTVAVKVLHSHYASDPGFLRRFLLEAQAAANLQHPSIVDVYDAGHDGDVQYIVMEYVDGSDLKTLLLRDGALPIDQAVRIAQHVAEALDVAHRAGLVHRDVKPQNIIVGSNGTVKITDFGIAKSSVASSMTETGVVFGTADYLSPEQARGQSATPRSDVYALGVTLYEMLTGRLPFTGDSSIAVAMQHLNGEPPPPRQYNPRIPAQLEALVLRALSKEADERPATAREFAQLLRTYRDAVEQETVARPRISPAPDGRAVAAAPEVARPSPARAVAAGGRPGSVDGLPPRAPLPPPRRTVSEPPPSRGTGFGGFLIGLLLLAGIVGLVYLAAIGTFNDLFSLVTGPPGVRPPRPTVVVPTEPGPTAPSQVPVPSLVGLDRQQAIQMLTAAQLQFVEAPARYSPTITSGLVLDQAPQAGALITATDVVTFALSLGPDTPEVPAVRGLRPEVARSRLAALGFQVEVVEEASTDMSAGFVTRTEPAPPARPLRGDTVTMFVSVGDKVQVPDVTGLPEAEAERLIRNAGLFVSWVDRQGPNQIPNFASIPEGTVVSSLPGGGKWVNRDTGVTLGVRGPNS